MENLGKCIIIVQAGFVFMGKVTRDATHYYVTEMENIRRWGTTRGLGEIALNGPTKSTILDLYGEGEFPRTSVIGCIKCHF